MTSHVMKKLGKTFDEMLEIFSTQCGMLGLSGVSADCRDVYEAAQAGNKQAALAFDVFVGDIRRYMGAFLVELGGADLIVFTGGIGEYQPTIRSKACRGLSELGIVLDEAKNETVMGQETEISAPESRTKIWVIPTNEEIIVARQTMAKLAERN